MRYWLMKSEPDEFSIDDLAKAPKQTTAWFGVRNYQARNFMRDDMRVGDRAFFYHSSCPEPGIAGIVLGVMGQKKVQAGEASNAGQAKAALICGGIGVVIGIINAIAGAAINLNNLGS